MITFDVELLRRASCVIGDDRFTEELRTVAWAIGISHLDDCLLVEDAECPNH